MNSEPTLPAAARVWTRDNQSLATALKSSTHLGIGAHHDDLEFWAFDGIVACRNQPGLGFAGITCTNGRGSAREGQLADLALDELAALRIAEQEEAARIGGYSAVVQLGYPSSEAGGLAITADLTKLLASSGAEVVYTHNPADKHATHLAVFSAVLQAIRSLPKDQRPRRLIGCEGWRDLDWMPDREKIRMDVSGHDDLAEKLNSIFVSQIGGGKRYDLAVPGRRRANATFAEPRAGDKATQVIHGMDLTPLILDDSLDPVEFACGFVRRFEEEVRAALNSHFQH